MRASLQASSLTLILLAAAAGHAQDRFEMRIGALGAFPRGEFEDALDDEGYGLNLFFGYRGFGSPWTVGLDFDFTRYDKTSLDDPFPCCPFIEEAETTNNIILGHVAARWQPAWPEFSPYLEGLLGVKRFETKTSLFADDFDEAIETDRNLTDTALSYGLGAGVELPLSGPRGPNLKPRIALQAGARWLWGEEAEYALSNTTVLVGDQPFFETAQTRTNLFNAHLGVAFRF